MIDMINTAIHLREVGKDKEALQMLLDLHKACPDNPHINYQCEWVHDKLGLEKEAVPFYEKALDLLLRALICLEFSSLFPFAHNFLMGSHVFQKRTL